MKNSVSFVILTVVFVLLVGCGSPVTPEPSATPEPTATSEPTATPEPTNTPEPTYTPTSEYCGVEEFFEAADVIVDLNSSFNDQVQIFANISDLSSDNLQVVNDVLVEVWKIGRELSELEVPECMAYLKQIFEEAVSDFKLCLTYILVGSLSESTVKGREAIIQIQLFSDEFERLLECVPNCEP